jgi:hypothetical protein
MPRRLVGISLALLVLLVRVLPVSTTASATAQTKDGSLSQT